MNWLPLSILSAAFYGLSSTLDKQIMGKYRMDPKACVFLAVCFDVCYAILIAIFAGFRFVPSVYSLAAFMAGLIGIGGGVIWYFTIKEENISMVSAIVASAPLYTFLLSVVFLKEVLSWQQVGGIFLVVLGSVLVSIRREKTKTSRNVLSKMLLPALLVSFLWGTSSVFAKYSLSGLNFWDSVVISTAGNLIGVLPVGFLAFKASGRKMFGSRTPLALIGASEAAVIVGLLLFRIAASTGSISLVSAASATQPLFVLLWIFILRNHHTAAREIGLENLKSIALGTALIIGGIYLIS